MANAVLKLASVINAPRATDQIMEKSTSLRSKCYQQLTELKNLKDSGVRSESESTDECDAILNVLKTIVNNDSGTINRISKLLLIAYCTLVFVLKVPTI